MKRPNILKNATMNLYETYVHWYNLADKTIIYGARQDDKWLLRMKWAGKKEKGALSNSFEN